MDGQDLRHQFFRASVTTYLTHYIIFNLLENHLFYKSQNITLVYDIINPFRASIVSNRRHNVLSLFYFHRRWVVYFSNILSNIQYSMVMV